MRKVSEVIRLAATNPLYLSSLLSDHAFLCNVIDRMSKAGDVTVAERQEAKAHIQQVLTASTLRIMIKRDHPDFANEGDVDSEDLRLRPYCRMFWAVLCMDLVRKGL